MSRQPPVFTSQDYDSEPGRDFDARVRYEPMVGDALADGLVKWPMKRTPICEKCKKFIYPRGSECPCGTEKGKSAA